MRKNIAYTILLTAGLLIGQIATAQKFTIPIFPDTQGEVGSRNDMFLSQINWIVKQKEKLNIPMALHVGDLVNFDNFNHFEVASKGLEILDQQRIPYAIAVGNHDTEAVGEFSGSAAPGNVNQNLRKTFKLNSYFPYTRFTNQRGRYENDKIDNSYYTFKVGDTNWLVISMEFCPRLGVINWAGDIAKAYYNYNVILLTHYYLTGKGEIAKNNAGYGDFSPQDMFDKLVKKHPNILMVLSGHVMSTALKVDKGDAGNSIYQILQNYQNEDNGGGYLRLLTVDIDKGRIDAEMYSPFYNKAKKDSSAFTIDNVKFLKMSDYKK
ncbi:metallophosphoesterase [Desertivirga brevis]|uniref:metallophosphoesterase n=1 Tax=Desertivirga brevis TaxID=2810310 RepID=UPI001A967532|nr:metallophosphoesterase [Pedobacter sp. SYSU D00873]